MCILIKNHVGLSMCLRNLFVPVFIVMFWLMPSTYSIAQTPNTGLLVVDGLVSGYEHEPSRGLLLKDKPITFEGTLEKVSITVSENDQPIFTTFTSKNGEFQLKFVVGKLYRVEFAKAAHAKSVLLIDARAIPNEIANVGIKFNHAELVLNKFQSKDSVALNQAFGRLYYDARTKMIDFEPAQIKTKSGLFGRRDEPNIPVSLMRKAVLKNKNSIATAIAEDSIRQNINKNINKFVRTYSRKKNKSDQTLETTVSDTVNDELFNSDFILTSFQNAEGLSESYLLTRETEIETARKQLAKDRLKAKTKADSILIEERESLLNAAVNELVTAKKLIQLQKGEIRMQKRLLLLTASILILLGIFIFTLFKHFKEKKRTHLLLKEKNKKITESINYAKHIQESILPLENEVKNLLPDSFIFYLPRDIVSGDFYWISEVEGKIIIAAVDCTGHGVPGAFMSLIGNTLLNEIINEKHITEPALILSNLHVGILKTLRQNIGEVNCQDGMEMSLLVIDQKKSSIEYAGAMNPAYIVKDNKVIVIKPDVLSIGGMYSGSTKDGKIQFTTRQLSIEKNMTLYLFTDGYMDQFGGPGNKKFNTLQFKKLLLEIQSKSMDEQKQAVEDAILSWKGSTRQIDDMLVIGIKF